MNDITALMATMKAAAEKAGCEQWQSKKNGPGEYGVMVKGSMVKHSGWSTHRPVCDEAVDKKTADFIAAANPANVKALVEALEKAQQQTTESENRVRKQNRHICELFDDNTALRQRIASLEESHAQVIQSRDHHKRMTEEGLKQLWESRTVTVKLPQRQEPTSSGHYGEGYLVPSYAGSALDYEDTIEVLTAAGIQVIEGDA